MGATSTFQLLRTIRFGVVLIAILGITQSPCSAAPPTSVLVVDTLATSETQIIGERLATELTRRGTKADLVSAETALQSDPNALWVIPHAEDVPAVLAHATAKHLRAGGKLLILGGVPFQHLLYKEGNKWVGRSEYLSSNLKSSPGLNFTAKLLPGFEIGTSHPDIPSTIALTSAAIPSARGVETKNVLVGTIPELKNYATFNTSVTLPANRAGDMTCFMARGTSATTMLALEWDEKDGSRWITKINLKPEWQFYCLQPEDYKYWYDSKVQGRGGKDDRVNFANVNKFSVGLAQTHTHLGNGPHEFAITDITFADGKLAAGEEFGDLPEIDGLYPKYMLYPVKPAFTRINPTYASAVGTGSGADQSLPLVKKGWSSAWRPMGSGWDMNRSRRFVPIVTAYNSNGSRAGTLAAITLSFTDYPGAIYGYVGVPDYDALLSDPWLNLIAAMADRMDKRLFLREAGSTQFTYDIRDLQTTPVQIGVETLKVSPAATAKKLAMAAAVVGDHKTLFERTVDFEAGASAAITTTTLAFDPKLSAGLEMTAALRYGDSVVDRIVQEIHFDGPRQGTSFVSAKDRLFWRDGKPFRLFGVNYMPSSGMARIASEGEQFEMWIADYSYDPEIVDYDLGRVASLGMNMVSAFIYSAPPERANLLDFLRLARKHGLLVNLSLRPNFNPLSAKDGVISSIVTQYRTNEKDEIFAYDVAWEPWWGRYMDRQKFGKQWAKWVEKKYGSQANAEKAWGWSPGEVALKDFPEDHELTTTGLWAKAVNDYREFVDDFLGADYGRARATLKELAPKQLMSFRQSEGGNPQVDPDWYPMDLRSVCNAVDFFSPEGYGMGGSDIGARNMSFTTSYAQGLAPGKPVIWAEYGMSVWMGDAFEPQPESLRTQAEIYERILSNAELSRSAGTIAWWYPGGYRTGEDSDYGVFNPDGTARPLEKVLRKYAKQAVAPPDPVKWTPEIRAPRTDSVRGYPGIYEKVGKEFFEKVTSDTIPLLITK